MEEALISHARLLIQNNLVAYLPMASIGNVDHDEDPEDDFTVYFDIHIDNIDVGFWASVNFIHGVMHRVRVTKFNNCVDNDTYTDSYLFGAYELAERFLREKVTPDIEQADFYETMRCAHDAQRQLLEAIDRLRKYAPEHLVCQDNTKFITLLADHFKYDTLGVGYEKAKSHFESKV